ncbi:LacI family DNA-binding transcriptional regulator (plasmid) [Rhizobium leguminosarum]|nr:LacI family DNA-binding transcriptional regulator [Rhizobium leguminosarum]
MAAKSRPTAADVARRADVGVATVDRVLNGRACEKGNGRSRQRGGRSYRLSCAAPHKTPDERKERKERPTWLRTSERDGSILSECRYWP